jgi:hypothetical protein
MSSFRRALAQVPAVLLLYLTCPAATIHVPGDQPTIQAGIDAAQDGDMVLVAAGTYTGEGNRSLIIADKSIKLLSEQGAVLTIVDCEELGRGLHVGPVTKGPVEVEGLSFINGRSEIESPSIGGAGLYIEACELELRGCRIEDNWAERAASRYVETYGGGVHITNSASVTMIGCSILNNRALSSAYSSSHTLSYCNGGGIYCSNLTSLELVGCLVAGNRVIAHASAAAWARGGGIYINQGTLNIRDSEITGNEVDAYCVYEATAIGGGIRTIDSQLLIDGGSIRENDIHADGGDYELEFGGAIAVEHGPAASIRNCIVTGNNGDPTIYVYNVFSTPLLIENCDIFSNSAFDYVRGEYITMKSCTVTECWMGFAVHGDELCTISNSIIWDAFLSSVTEVSFSNIQGGHAGTGNIDADPLFVTGPYGEHYLSQVDAGQDEDSPCLDAGDPDGDLVEGTTRTDGDQDTAILDMGYHYSLAEGTFICLQPATILIPLGFNESPPENQTLEIWRCGTGTLDWTVTSDVDWIELSPGNGSSDGEVDQVVAEFNIPDFFQGAHEATITFDAPGAVNTPQQVQVYLERDYRGLATGPGPGYPNPPVIRVFPPEQNADWAFEFNAYSPPHCGSNVTCGDMDGDGLVEIITGAGPGEMYGPHVRGFKADGSSLVGLSFLAYATHRFGVNVAAGDLDGDGYGEIITGAGPGAIFGPHVRAFDYDGTPGVTPVPGVSFFAYGTPRWGVNVAAGDIDGDGFDEIITGAGPGAVYGPHVRGWNVDGGSATPIPGLSYLAYGTSKYGVNVTAGDVDGDGMDEIVTGAGPGEVFGPHVRGWNYDGSGITPLPGLSFFAWQTPPLRFGVNVFAGADLNHDGRDELVAGRGPDPDADTEVKVFTYDGVTVSQWLSLEPFPGMTYGANVAAGRF